MIGGTNKNQVTGALENTLIGNDNVMTYGERGCKMIGKSLIDNDKDVCRIYLGTFNKAQTSTTSHPLSYGLTIGAGIANNNRRNALEIFTSASTSEFHIPSPFKLSLNTLGTVANEITPALSTPASADDMTLATKAYVDGHTIGISVNREETLASSAGVNISVGNSVNLETDFSITIPSWAKQIELGIVNSGGFTEYLTIDATDDDTYASVSGAGTIDVYDYNHTTKDFTFTSGGTSMRISSLRVKGVQNI